MSDERSEVATKPSVALYARIPKRVYDALKAYADEKGHTLSRATADLLTASLVSEELPGTMPHEISAYLFGRRMFAVISGLVDAVNESPAPDEEGADVQ